MLVSPISASFNKFYLEIIGTSIIGLQAAMKGFHSSSEVTTLTRHGHQHRKSDMVCLSAADKVQVKTDTRGRSDKGNENSIRSKLGASARAVGNTGLLI